MLRSIRVKIYKGRVRCGFGLRLQADLRLEHGDAEDPLRILKSKSDKPYARRDAERQRRLLALRHMCEDDGGHDQDRPRRSEKDVVDRRKL